MENDYYGIYWAEKNLIIQTDFSGSIFRAPINKRTSEQAANANACQQRL